MRLIKQKAEFLGQTPTDRRLLLMFLERVGRICYKSEDAITDTSAPEFCEKKFGVGHFSIFDHSNIVFELPDRFAFAFHRSLLIFPRRAGFHNYYEGPNGKIFVNGNARAWEETLRLLLAVTIAHKQAGLYPLVEPVVVQFCNQLMKYMPEVFKFDLSSVSNSILYKAGIKLAKDQARIPANLKTYSSFWITDRSVTHELVRHRPCAFMQESQRYVTYKSGLTCIIPPLVNLPEGDYEWGQNNAGRLVPFHGDKIVENISNNELTWLCAMLEDEKVYRDLVKDKEYNPDGWTPEHARDVLPNSCKTEIMTTADLAEWKHIFNMRCAKTAHPKIREMALATLEQFQNDHEIRNSGLLAEQFRKFLPAKDEVDHTGAEL